MGEGGLNLSTKPLEIDTPVNNESLLYFTMQKIVSEKCTFLFPTKIGGIESTPPPLIFRGYNPLPLAVKWSKVNRKASLFSNSE